MKYKTDKEAFDEIHRLMEEWGWSKVQKLEALLTLSRCASKE